MTMSDNSKLSDKIQISNMWLQHLNAFHETSVSQGQY